MVKDSEMTAFVDTVAEEEQQLEGDDDDDETMDIQEDQAQVTSAWPRARRFLSKRQMAKISPRLGLLNNLPMTLPFATRVDIMIRFI
jgi:ubiquitin-protein ligase E3 C